MTYLNCFVKKNLLTNLKMQYKTYFAYFKKNCHYSFKKPKSNGCDFCTANEIILSVNPNDPCKVSYMIHKRKVEKYMSTKRELLKRCETEINVLVVEFDYGQNLPVLKLNVTSQFHKRLLWLYLFNVHFHNDRSLYMYYFIETLSKEGTFSGVFLFKRLAQNSSISEIFLLSDACGGQNKNFVFFLSACGFLKSSK